MTRELEPQTVAQFLREHPEFLNTHADVFASLTVPNPHGGKAVSLVERQLYTVKEKLRVQEQRLADLVRMGVENDAIVEKLAAWTRPLVGARDAAELPSLVVQGLRNQFNVPLCAMRIWELDAAFDHLPCAAPVAVDVITFANSLVAPHCGPNSGYAAAAWLDAPAASVALLPLRIGAAPQAFGLIVMGSPDPARFSSDMGVTMLGRMAVTASAALSRLLPASKPAVARAGT
jgi:uncharacterized protein YigA (DUF484 family)